MELDSDIKVRIPASHKAEFERIARRRKGGVKVSVIYREALEEFLERHAQEFQPESPPVPKQAQARRASGR